MAETEEFENIWITSCARIEAHARFSFYDILSHLLLTLYSLGLLGLSVFEKQLASTWLGSNVESIFIMLSVYVLCASLIIWGLRFGETARLHKECYLKLRQLYDTEKDDTQDKISQYHQILERYPNHSDQDNERYLYKKIWREGVNVINTKGPVKMGPHRAMRFLIVEFLRKFIIGAIVFLPLIIIASLYVLSPS